MCVHARTIVLEDRLRHEGERLAGLPCNVLQDVLEGHELISHLQKGVELDADFALTTRGNLVVMKFGLNANAMKGEGHVTAKILVVIHRRHREVALLGTRLVTKVRTFVGAGVPFTFDGVDHVERAIGLRVETNVIEHEELGFGTKERRVGNASGLEIRLGLGCDITRIARVALVRYRIGHVTMDDRGLVLHERIHVHGVRIGDEHHVRFLNLLETTNR